MVHIGTVYAADATEIARMVRALSDATRRRGITLGRGIT